VLLSTPTDKVTAKCRLVGIRMTLLTLRMRENWARLFGGDEEAMIGLAIVATVSERLLRSEIDPHLESLEKPMPLEELSSCNITSIATATGLNRETARRKVNALVERGLLVKDKGGIRLAPGFTQQESACATVRSQADEVRRAINDLIRAGVIDIEP
jgi:IclR-like helix-turn-helix domain-containing protein